jgi:anti-anti-sigma factor
MRCGVAVRETVTGVLLSLCGSADVGAARELKDAFTSALRPGQDVLVDLNEVERLDAAGLQLLIAVQAWVRARGGAFALALKDGPALRALEVAGALPLFSLQKGDS